MSKNSFIEILRKYKQIDLVNHLNRLPHDLQEHFIKNNSHLDLELVFNLHKECLQPKDPLSLNVAIKPANIIPLPKTPTEKKFRQKAKLMGESLISSEKVAILIVAGGQGVRLGHDKPKGTFPVTPVMNKTLFHLFSDQVGALSFRYNARIPLLIMTSNENHDDTVSFFENFDFFGLDKNNVYFFQQGMLPSISPEGRLLLKDETNIYVNPDGHGGSLMALYKSGYLNSLIEQGYTELFYCQVDNPLLKIADPIFLGYHSLEKAECSTKVVRRNNIEEKVGVYVSLNGKDSIIEYSEFGGSHMSAFDYDGSILYWAGNTAIHVFNLAFIKSLNENGFVLPYHCANKDVEIIGTDGSVKTEKVWKFESFVFDAIPLAEKTCCLEVDRAEEFSPVKNRSGADSPMTARASMVRLHKKWLRSAGVKIPHQFAVEISPTFALDKEELIRKLKGTLRSITKDTYFGLSLVTVLNILFS